MTEPKKWALLIGIGVYQEYYYGAGKLRGCVNDARLMASILQGSFGFPVANTTLLLDEDATRETILAAIHDLAAHIQEGDVAVVFYRCLQSEWAGSRVSVSRKRGAGWSLSVPWPCQGR